MTTTLCVAPAGAPSPGFAGEYVVVPLFCGAITTEPPLSAGIAAAVVSGPGKPCACAAGAERA